MNHSLQQKIAQAQGLLQQGRAADAASLCRQLLKSAPGEPNLQLLLALALGLAGNLDGADRAFREALKASPKHADLLLNYGRFLRDTSRTEEAERQLQKAVSVAPDLQPAWHALGILYLNNGRWGDAAQCAHRMTQLKQNDPAGWELLAAAAQKRGDVIGAMEVCREGLKHAPNAPRLYYSLGQLQRQNCDFAEAAAAYERAREFGFNHPDLFRNQAEALLDAGEAEAAMACATAGAERFPSHATLQRTTARLHFEVSAPGDPLARLQAAARAEPGNPELWQTLVQLQKRLKREEESAATLQEALRLGCPVTPGMLSLEAQETARQGDLESATRKFENLLQTFPGHNDGKLDFATHLIIAGDPRRAEALCGEILQDDPYNQLALSYRGTALQLMNDPREAWLLDYQRMVLPVPVPIPDGYGSREEFFAELQRVLERLHQTKAHPIEQSVRGGTQTNGFLFRLREAMLQTLERQLRLAVASAFDRFPDDPDHPFWGRRKPGMGKDDLRFSGAWSVRLKNQGYHTNHIHPEGWISSALYVALPDEVRDPSDNSGYIQFGSPLEDLGIDLPPRRTVAPEVGTLVLFPSYMWHGTIPFHSEQPRITVAFDLQPGP